MKWFSRRKVGRRREQTAASSPTLALPKGEPGFRKQERERIFRNALIAEVREIVFVRDWGGCRVPGCGSPSRLVTDEMHEIRSRAELRGRPDAEIFNRANCIRLCRDHHRDVTEHRLRVRCMTDQGADGEVVFEPVYHVDLAGAEPSYTVIDDPTLPEVGPELMAEARTRLLGMVEQLENRIFTSGESTMPPENRGGTPGRAILSDTELRREFLAAVRSNNAPAAEALERELFRRRGMTAEDRARERNREERQREAENRRAPAGSLLRPAVNVNVASRLDLSAMTSSAMLMTSSALYSSQVMTGSAFAPYVGRAFDPRQYRNDGAVVLRDAKGFELSRMLPTGTTRNPPDTIEIAVTGGMTTVPVGGILEPVGRIPSVTFENTGEYDDLGRLVYRERVSKKHATVEQPKGRAIIVEK
jgi:hypothetical protein